MDEIYSKKAETEDEHELKRMFGSIIGAFVGDAAGAVLEFMDVVTDVHVDEAL